MAGYILVGAQGKRTDKEYYRDIVRSFEGRIQYSTDIYEDTAFQWLGPILIMFRKSINYETRFVKAFWLGLEGNLGATGCRVSDSWGYHPGTVWHKVKPDEEDMMAYAEFVSNKNNKDVVDKYLIRKEGFVTDRNKYLAQARKVWKERATKNLKTYVSFDEIDMCKRILEKG